MMTHLKRFKGFVYLLVISLMFSIIPVEVFAQQDEHLTITTYYPSPFGSYNEVSVFQHLNFDVSGQTIRVKNAAGIYIDVMRLHDNSIEFLVPVNIRSGPLTIPHPLLPFAPLDVGGALLARYLWDWAIYGNQQAQTTIMGGICACVALLDAVEAVMIAGVIASIAAMIALPPPIL